MNWFKATAIIWFRELIHLWRDRLRMLGALMIPFMWLVMFGSGISSSLQFSGPEAIGNFKYVKFLFPGVLGVTVLFTSIFSAVAIVADREFGFLKEIFVAPIPRSSIAIGRILGGATVATIQGMLMLILLPLVGLPLKINLLALVPPIFLFALLITSIGVVISAKIKSMEGFQTIMQFITFPMFMLSSALFPLRNAPGWLELLSKINPATYGIDLLRKIAFRIFAVPEILTAHFSTSLFNVTLTIWDDVLILALVTGIMIIAATRLFQNQEI